MDAARRRGVGTWAGVPCSYLQPLINHVIDSPQGRYVAAVNEAHAVAIAAGSGLGGRLGVAMLQNSGLGNAINPLTSLVQVFDLPLLVIVTLRGEPGGKPDEPQHELMGRITTQLLDLMGIPWAWFPTRSEEVEPRLDAALDHFAATGRAYALVMRRGSVAAQELATPAELPACEPAWPLPEPVAPIATRARILAAIQAAAGPRDLVVATTGYTGRELAALDDRPSQLYMVGSMGCAPSLGLGLALAQPTRRVIVIDGDGALLMHLGALATLGHERPPNLVHLVLDNGAYESTGGQATVSGSVDFCALARGCGFPRGGRASAPGEVEGFLRDHAEDPALALLHVPILPGTMKELPRPAHAPPEVARRLRRHLGVES